MDVGLSEGPAPLILTAILDPRSQALFNDLREAYFPPERNVLDAHLTLFHALPGAFEEAIVRAVQEEARRLQALRFAAPMPYGLGRGVAIAIECAPLLALQVRLREALEGWPGCSLTAQDRAKRKLHVTVQNKVSPQDARRTLQGIAMAWNPSLAGDVTGLALWHYRGGPWELATTISFAPA